MKYVPEAVEGKICYVIYNDLGEPVRTKEGKLRYFCVEANAQAHVGKLTSKSTPARSFAAPPSPPKMPEIVAARRQQIKDEHKGTVKERSGDDNCSICSEPLSDPQDRVKVPKGRWTHKECAPKEVERVRANVLAAGKAVRENQWLPLPLADSAMTFLHEPMLPEIQRVPAGQFTTRSIVRLLARPDRDGFRVVERLFHLMLQRQTPEEQRQGRATQLNATGFSSPDASTAKALQEELALKGWSPDLHLRMSTLLLNYAKTQLPEIMNHGRLPGRDFSLLTNPRY